MLKLVALVALFAGFCWFGTQVQLGPHTLFGHLHAIAGTRESQELFDGTRASARPLVDDVRRRIAGVPAPAKEPSAPVEEADDVPDHKKGEVAKAEDAQPSKAKPDSMKPDDMKPEAAKDQVAHAAPRRPEAGPAQETLTPSERRRLRRLISSAEGASARQ
jgi:hypothetical protein